MTSNDVFPLGGAIAITLVMVIIVGARLHGARNRLKFGGIVLGIVVLGTVDLALPK